MPAHIYVLCGMYEEAKSASEKAVRADDLYLAQMDTDTDAPGSYYLLACCHDLHLMMFACMFLGQLKPALWAADKIRGFTTREMIALPDRPKLTQTMEGYHAMKSHVLVRFGRWREIIDEPMADDPALYVLTTAMQHYAKGVAHATVRDFAAADRQRELFSMHLDRIPPERRFLSNPAHASLAVGAALLDGELTYHKGRHEEAYRHLRRAVELDDNLSYTEPWAWMHPPRHALAALLLDQGHVTEAEQVYRDDLGLSGAVQRCAQHPDNVWALHGLVECLTRRGETEELPQVQDRLRAALAKTDVPISSSCLCRTSMQSATRCCH
jgi:tetratricopeptide (TPR) repeat protein